MNGAKTYPYELIERAWCEPVIIPEGDLPPKCYDCEDYSTHMVRYETKNDGEMVQAAVCDQHKAMRQYDAGRHFIPWTDTAQGS